MRRRLSVAFLAIIAVAWGLSAVFHSEVVAKPPPPVTTIDSLVSRLDTLARLDRSRLDVERQYLGAVKARNTPSPSWSPEAVATAIGTLVAFLGVVVASIGVILAWRGVNIAAGIEALIGLQSRRAEHTAKLHDLNRTTIDHPHLFYQSYKPELDRSHFPPGCAGQLAFEQLRLNFISRLYDYYRGPDVFAGYRPTPAQASKDDDDWKAWESYIKDAIEQSSGLRVVSQLRRMDLMYPKAFVKYMKSIGGATFFDSSCGPSTSAEWLQALGSGGSPSDLASMSVDGLNPPIKLETSHEVRDYSPILTGLLDLFGAEFAKSVLRWTGGLPLKPDTVMWRVFLVCVNEHRVGICGLYQDKPDPPDRCWVGWFGFIPAFRSQGIGGRVVEHLARVARTQGYRELYVFTAHSNDRAKHFYEEHQFVELQDKTKVVDRLFEPSDVVLVRSL